MSTLVSDDLQQKFIQFEERYYLPTPTMEECQSALVDLAEILWPQLNDYCVDNRLQNPG